jgi:hypothetical protein
MKKITEFMRLLQKRCWTLRDCFAWCKSVSECTSRFVRVAQHENSTWLLTGHVCKRGCKTRKSQAPRLDTAFWLVSQLTRNWLEKLQTCICRGGPLSDATTCTALLGLAWCNTMKYSNFLMANVDSQRRLTGIHVTPWLKPEWAAPQHCWLRNHFNQTSAMSVLCYASLVSLVSLLSLSSGISSP